MKKLMIHVMILMLLVPIAFVSTACGQEGKIGPQGEKGQQGEQGEKGEQGVIGPVLNFDLNNVMVREQRETKRFYAVGSGAVASETPEYGHMGTQAEGAVKVKGSTIKIKTSPYATAIAFNVAKMFTGVENVKMWGNPFPSTTYVDLTAEGNFHMYDTVDAGWGAGHKPAYFVINAPAEGEERVVNVNALYKGKFSTFHIVIERAAE